MRLYAPITAMFLAGVVTVLPLGSGVSLAAPKVGVAAAVNNDVQGIQAGASRALATGNSVFEQERIRTGAESDAQLLFLDQTTLSVGPRSEVTLDRFIYNPSRGSGDVLLSATRGAFRFISGTQNPLNYKISTPLATIGVRGTIIRCSIGSLFCSILEGTAIFNFGGQSIAVKAGESIRINNDRTFAVFEDDSAFAELTGDPTWTTDLEDPRWTLNEELTERDLIIIDDEPPDPCQIDPEFCDCNDCQIPQ